MQERFATASLDPQLTASLAGILKDIINYTKVVCVRSKLHKKDYCTSLYRKQKDVSLITA